MKRAIAVAAVLAAGFAALTTARAQGVQEPEGDVAKVCTSATIRGAYGYVAGPGWSGLSTSNPIRLASIGRLTFDGVGHVSGPVAVSEQGVISSTTFAGTYTVQPDCTGRILYGLGGAAQTAVNDFVVVDDGNEILSLVANPTQVWTSVAKRLFSRRRD